MHAYYYVDNKFYAVMAFTDCNTNEIKTFVISDKDIYNELYKYIDENIYNFKTGSQRSLLVGWNNSSDNNAIINNCLTRKRAIYYSTINTYKGKNVFNIADLYTIMNFKHRYSIDTYQDERTILRYLLMLNNIAIVDKHFNNDKELIDIVNELSAGLSILALKYQDYINFSYKYGLYYKDRNINMSPIKAAIKKMLINTHIDNKTIKDVLYANKQAPRSLSAKQMYIANIPIDDRKFIDVINKTDFIKHNNELYLYNVGTKQIKISKVGITYSEKELYKNDDINDIVYIDMKSFFPTILINNKLTPNIFKNNKEKFLEQINKIISLKEETNSTIYKDILLQMIGLFNKEGVLYDPSVFYSITINGILLMINLIETIYHNIPTMNLLHAKIDGLIIEIRKNNIELLQAVINEWSKKYNYVVKVLRVKKMLLKNSNNYIMEYYSDKRYDHSKDDIIKNYRDIIYDTDIIKGYNVNDKESYGIAVSGKFNVKNLATDIPTITKIATIYHFIFNIPVIDIVMNSNNIFHYALNFYSKDEFKLRYVKNNSIVLEDYNNDIIKFYISNNNQDAVILNKNKPLIPQCNMAIVKNTNIDELENIKYSWYVDQVVSLLQVIPETLF